MKHNYIMWKIRMTKESYMFVGSQTCYFHCGKCKKKESINGKRNKASNEGRAHDLKNVTADEHIDNLR